MVASLSGICLRVLNKCVTSQPYFWQESNHFLLVNLDLLAQEQNEEKPEAIYISSSRIFTRRFVVRFPLLGKGTRMRSYAIHRYRVPRCFWLMMRMLWNRLNGLKELQNPSVQLNTKSLCAFLPSKNILEPLILFCLLLDDLPDLRHCLRAIFFVEILLESIATNGYLIVYRIRLM